LAERLQLGPEERVLDIGSGIGGPARFLAAEYGCRAYGIDLTAEFCAVATELSRRLGLSEQTEFVHGSALDLPFDEASFDVATLLHVGMNIEDKNRLVGEVARVLRPGGQFAVYDLFEASREALHFPVPWAHDASTSFLVRVEDFVALLEAHGFEVEERHDLTEFALEFFRRMAESQQAGTAPAVALPILMGPHAGERLSNLAQNLRQGSVAPWQMIARKPSSASP
jgi:ubiquinone/menaquinone biosynthesis C-methylase UbiE